MSSDCDYKLVSTVSADFHEAARIFLPSWMRNARAREIDLATIRTGTWYEAIIARNQHIRDSVIDAADNGVRVVALDIDCFILSDLSGAFDGWHPISVTRWPRPNMGAIWFDTRLPFDWEEFFSPLLTAITRRCRDPDNWSRPEQKKGRFGDQYPWWLALQQLGHKVGRLEMETWNFCHQTEDWQRELMAAKDRVKVIHIKGRGGWMDKPQYRAKIALARELFGERIA